MRVVLREVGLAVFFGMSFLGFMGDFWVLVGSFFKAEVAKVETFFSSSFWMVLAKL